MRILIATRYIEVLGGTEGYLRALLPALIARGHQIAILHEEPPSQQRDRIDADCPDLEVWGYSHTQKGIPPGVLAWRPDLVFRHGSSTSYHDKLLLDRFPVILFAHDYLGTCISGYKRFAFPWPMPCQRVLGPACLALYFPRACGGLNPITMIRAYREQRRRQADLGRHRNILVASKHMREEFMRHGVPADRVLLAPFFPPRSLPDIEPPKERSFRNRVIFVGRMTDLKGGLEFITALSLVIPRLRRPITSVAIGDGPDQDELKRRAYDLGVPTVFTGWVDTVQRDQWMRDSDVIAVPSVWPEPYGLVGLEAGCVGLPAVGFAVGGIPDWLIPGETGELAPGDPPTAEGLADALFRALSDQDHLLRLRRGSWEFAKRCTLARHVDWLEPVLARAAEASA